MNYRDLVNKLDAIERGETLSEAITIKDVTAAVQGKTNEQERAAILNDLAWKNNLPGLYDPVSGYFVSKQGMPSGDGGGNYSIAASASKDADMTLAKLGLVPKNAQTSSALGKFFGASGDMYDKGVQATNQEVLSQQEKAELIKTSLTKLGELLKKLTDTVAQEKKFKDAVAAQVAKQSGAAGKPKVTVKEGSIASSLVESFGYESNFNEANSVAGELGKTAAVGGAGYVGGKALSKMTGKVIPGVGAAFGAYDAYDRYKKGDYLGAGLAGLSGAVSLIPGVGWIPALGLDMINLGRDLKGGGTTGKEEPGQGTKPVAGADQKLIQLQQKIGAKPDGIMGPETKQKLIAWQQKMGIAADGVPGPETYAKAGIKESIIMTKSVAESIRELQDRLAIIENEEDGLEVPAMEGGEEPIMFNKDGKSYALLPDGRLVDEQGNLIDGSKPDLPVIGDAQLGEGLGWLKNVFGNFAAGLKNAPKFGQAGAALGKTGSAATQFQKAGKVATAANRTGKFIANNPLKAGAVAGLGGLGAGYAMASPNAPAGGTAGGQAGGQAGGGQGGKPQPSTTTPAAEPEAEQASPEVQAIVAEIQKLMADMGKIDDPAIKSALVSAQQQIDAIPGIKK